ncbi:hypothetical protein J5N97_001126 [Dioscorea zingiberensis]|uniref:K Homology domain-containing protein n=1 Tax=Dioscorea zingiberensis TaxID=325984 RepID=A0A9D5BVI6_9LILI|nr:hypothetical protein J5N97_001126 [Dioscorea zingiberensis]
MEALKTIYGSDCDDDADDGEPPMNGVEFKEASPFPQPPHDSSKLQTSTILLQPRELAEFGASHIGSELTVRESISFHDEITVEIKGTTQEVQIAEMLIQEFISGYREPEAGSYGNHDAGQISYSQMPSSGYYPSQ